MALKKISRSNERRSVIFTEMQHLQCLSGFPSPHQEERIRAKHFKAYAIIEHANKIIREGGKIKLTDYSYSASWSARDFDKSESETIYFISEGEVKISGNDDRNSGYSSGDAPYGISPSNYEGKGEDENYTLLSELDSSCFDLEIDCRTHNHQYYYNTMDISHNRGCLSFEWNEEQSARDSEDGCEEQNWVAPPYLFGEILELMKKHQVELFHYTSYQYAGGNYGKKFFKLPYFETFTVNCK